MYNPPFPSPLLSPPLILRGHPSSLGTINRTPRFPSITVSGLLKNNLKTKNKNKNTKNNLPPSLPPFASPSTQPWQLLLRFASLHCVGSPNTMRTRPNLAAASSATSGAIIAMGTDTDLDRSAERTPPAPASGWFGGGVMLFSAGRDITVAIGEYPPTPGPAPPPAPRATVDDVFDRRPAGDPAAVAAGLRILGPDIDVPARIRDDEPLPPPPPPPAAAVDPGGAGGAEEKSSVLRVALTGVILSGAFTEEEDAGVPIAAAAAFFEVFKPVDSAFEPNPLSASPPPPPPPASGSDDDPAAVSSDTDIAVLVALSLSAALGCRCRSPSKSFLRSDAKKPSSSSSSSSSSPPSLLGPPLPPPLPPAASSMMPALLSAEPPLQMDVDEDGS